MGYAGLRRLRDTSREIVGEHFLVAVRAVRTIRDAAGEKEQQWKHTHVAYPSGRGGLAAERTASRV